MINDIQTQTILLYFGPLVLLASLVEAVVFSWRARYAALQGDDGPVETYDWRSMGVSLMDQVGRNLLSLLPISLAAPVLFLAEQHQLFDLRLESWMSILALFVAQEFFYYWYHRTAHRMRFFWANHAVHHSPNQLNLSAAYRLGWFGKVAGAAIFFTPLVWLGFDAKLVLSMLAINLLYQFWLHATWIPKLGWLEYVLNTPSAHRVHHASNVRYLDANYGGVLIIFDRLFGTYIEESDDERCVYGWRKPERSYNPLRIELGPWIALFRDMASASTLPKALAYLVKPPGWRADGPGETTEELRGGQHAAGSVRNGTAIVTLMLAAGFLGAFAHAQDDSEGFGAERIRQLQERLDLTDAQLRKVAPVLEKSAASQKQLLAGYGIDLDRRKGPDEGLEMRQALKLRREMSALRSSTLGALGEILNDEQLMLFEQLQSERRAELRSLIRGNR